ncbi:terminase [Pseudohongiella sp. O18]|uniref:terminase n=1 Tax=Pseudohongiella sp. O18 TaxID=2904248 RepID=UPI0039838307
MPSEVIANLTNRDWRLNNLYWIKNKEGRRVKFRMNPEQRDYYDRQHTRNIILKARQLGFTTEQCIIQLDSALFESGQCAMIAHNLDDAKRLFREKVKYAYDSLPTLIKKANPARNDRAGELVFENGGSVTVSTSFRGGTLRKLHVSEFGKICAKYPEKAREIVTGAFEAVSSTCQITIESTAEGRQGYFYDYCQDAEKLQIKGRELSALDWQFFFYPWWRNPEYTLESSAEIPERLQNYFSEIEGKGISLTDSQKRWYAAKEKTLGDDIKREYPSIPAEAFAQTIQGAYYAKQFAEIYKDGRICKAPDNSHLPVYTFWDIGVGDSTAIWFVRMVGNEYHIIDYYENSGEGLKHYLKVLKERGYTYAEHWAPHDIENRDFSGNGKSRREMARDGYDIDGETYSIDFNVVPNGSIDVGIESVREVLPHCVFDEVPTEAGVKCLEAYRKEWDGDKGCWKDKPLHDWASHGADAFRYFAVAVKNIRKIAMSMKMEMAY